MIKTTAIGNLGGDCNVNNVNGKNVINWSLAHTEKYKDAQGVAHERVIWVRCAYWTDKTAIAPYLKKGTLVYVEGQPEVGVYQDKQGKWQAEFKLRVNQVQLLGAKKEDGQQPQSHSTQQQYGNSNANSGATYQSPSDITEPMDDLPF
jgi:single-strand DNA-binding protein